ncbi:MAG: CopG family ribbon-helix-helix protein [Candidatus Binataceae bacterium]
MTLRLDASELRRLDKLAGATARSKAWLAAQAIRDYLDLNEWQVRAIEAAVKTADRPGAKFIEHDQVDAWLASWGTAKESARPR